MSKDYESEIHALADRLTVEEKVSMIHGSGFFRTTPVERLGIPELKMSDGPMGVRMEFPDDSWIPLGKSDDYVTYNPCNSALAATWNPKLAYESGNVLGAEAAGRGKDVILAPGINIKRDPLCGRNFEYMSEDPYLIETMVVPFIKGVQENDVAACVKHFAVNNQETDRLAVDTLVDERALREIYLPGFRAAVQEGGAYSLMNAYNKFRGVFCSENKELLDGILREEWKYDGVVISDWGAVHSTKETAETSMDLEMSVTPDFDQYYLASPLLDALRKGEVSEEAVNAKVTNILRMMFRLKMLGEEAPRRKQGAYNTEEHRQSTLKVAREAIVLLKNEPSDISGGETRILPLTPERLTPVSVKKEGNPGVTGVRKHKIAVIGSNGERIHSCGGGSAEIKALYEISPLMGLKKALGRNVEISYAQGYYIPAKENESEVNWQEASLERQVMEMQDMDAKEQRKMREEILQNRAKLLQEACALAREADTVIFVGGLNHDYDMESRDRADMKLPYGQDELVEALLDICPDMICVMVAGSPVEMPWRDRVKALVWCYYSGMETGDALADILLGRINPSAKLPETFPAAYADTATFKNGQFGLEGSVEYREGIFVGYRYYEKEGIRPAFPFGHGLSYTDFIMDRLKVESQTPEEVVLSVEVSNVGSMDGAEVVQCYVTDCACSVERSVKELKAYEKVFLRSGEKKEVRLTLPRRSFAFYDVERKDFVVEPGEFMLNVGNSSDHCTLSAKITV
ncbi:MAG: glycoside hydrolase family 3 C-terminal domain-containing protein [Candidatus Gastranaerophilales bacterium]|nr:glycoside hydrolase family 3 C-terminal domain-containing protein [Candidatus Gastranaerophilales bacterium]MCM1525740.1 glycoside hydrolase family 3 C-terminal domain-containing protein [Bacteroides sp.]